MPKRAATQSAVARPAPKPDLTAPPNKILFAQNLPEECTQEMLVMLFKQCVGVGGRGLRRLLALADLARIALPRRYHGFKEVRMIPGKKSIAFVEFEDVIPAGIALQALQDFRLTQTHKLVLSYAKQG